MDSRSNLPTFKEKVEAILKNKTPFNFMGRVFVKRLIKKCRCGAKAEYIYYDKLFKFSPIIGLSCSRCKYDAEHPGHSGSGYETYPIKDIPKKQFKKVLGVLYLSKIFIQISKPREFRNLEKSLQKMLSIDGKSLIAKDRLSEHKKMADAVYTILKY